MRTVKELRAFIANLPDQLQVETSNMDEILFVCPESRDTVAEFRSDDKSWQEKYQIQAEAS